MPLKELIEEIKIAKETAETDPKDVDPRFRAGVEAKARNAKDSIAPLQRQYMAEIQSVILLVEVGGPGAQAFSSLAREKMKVLAFDHRSIVKRLADAVRSRGGQEDFGSNEQALLGSEMLSLKNAYAIAALPPLVPNEVKPSVFSQPLESAIQRLIEHTYGGGLYDTITLRDAQMQALEAGFTGKVMPVLVHNYYLGNPQLMLLNPPTFRIAAPEDVTIEYVKEELLNIKNKLKKPNEKTKETQENKEVGGSNG